MTAVKPIMLCNLPDWVKLKRDPDVAAMASAWEAEHKENLQELRAELEKFFLAAVAFEGKDLRVLGWNGPSEANQLIKKSLIVSDDEEAERVGHADGRAAHRG